MDEFAQVAFKRTRIMAVLLLGVVPVIYLAVGQLVEVVPHEVVPHEVVPHEGGESDLLFYILIFLALAQPALYPIIERVQISNFSKAVNRTMKPAQFAFTIALTKLAMVDAIYIFGLVVYFLSGDLSRMLMFYLPGLLWTAIYWPRESSFEELLKKLERP
ncbi:MAG: hypothetical protein P1R58_08665 [bacterium]|nr:hypothetical protein [bacterium]